MNNINKKLKSGFSFLLIILIAIFINGCAATKPIVYTPTQNPIRINPSSNTDLIAFSNVIFDVPTGSLVGAHHDGLAKVSQRSYYWEESLMYGNEKFTLIANEELRKTGYNVSGPTSTLFSTNDISQTRFILACKVVDLTLNTYAPLAGNYSESYLRISWELMDRYQNKVIFKFTTNGTGQVHGYKGINSAFEAFRSSIRNLLSTRSFVDAVLSTKASVAFEDWEKIEKNKNELIKYFDQNFEELNPIEGIWTSIEDNRYQIGIFKDHSNENRDYVATIIETQNPLWIPNQVKIEFLKTAYPTVYTTTYYMSDHSKQGTTSLVNEYGILEIKLRNQDGSPLESNFVKNYPENVEGSFSGSIGSTGKKIESSGSGLIISKAGLVFTNYHVVENKDEIDIYFPTIDKTFNANISLKDKNNDIVILRMSDFKYADLFSKEIPFKIEPSNVVKIGQEVFTLGFPLGEFLGTQSKLSTGIINSLYGIQDDPRLFQISNPIQPGNSGGPLFNKNGDLVGIVVASLNAKYFYENSSIIPQNVNFAIKGDYLLNLISMLPEENEFSKQRNSLSGKNLEKQVELITPYVVTIRAK